MSSNNLDRTYAAGYIPYGAEADQHKYTTIQKAARTFAEVVLCLCPPSREQSLALVDIQRAMQMAHAAIMIHEWTDRTRTEPKQSVVAKPANDDITMVVTPTNGSGHEQPTK